LKLILKFLNGLKYWYFSESSTRSNKEQWALLKSLRENLMKSEMAGVPNLKSM